MKINERNNAMYVKACKREALFWGGEGRYADREIPQRVTSYENLQKTGDQHTDELGFIESLGVFPRALSLGSGGGSYELTLLQKGIVEHFTFIDISQKALNVLEENAKALGLSDKIETHIQDFNFLSLSENTYDLISCQNMLHHIVNLEDSLHILNRALTATGIFITNECIGENKMYWSDAKMGFIYALQGLLHEKGIKTKEYIRTNPKVLTNNCPFECIRSQELYGILQHYFGKSIVKESLYGHLYHLWDALTDDISDTYFDLLDLMDTFVSKHGLLLPNRLFGVYKRSDAPLLLSAPWSKKELEKQIGISTISERSIMLRAHKISKKYPKFHNILKRFYFLLRK